MGYRAVDRAFTKVYATVKDQVNDIEEKTVRKSAAGVKRDLEESLRTSKQPMTAQDAIARVKLAWKDKDYFRLLNLPLPDIDELDRPVWSCTPNDVSRAYRKLSVLVHPDKNPGSDAREAFEALNEAHRKLKDPAGLEEILKEGAAKTKREKERREARASGDERIQLNAFKRERAGQLRAEQGKSFQAEVAEKARQRMEAAKRRKELQARHEERGGQEGVTVNLEADDDEEPAMLARKKKRRPLFM